VEKFAEHRELSVLDAKRFIELGRTIHENNVQCIKNEGALK
jgi:hypothetical protein